jgi:hypothetical protein
MAAAADWVVELVAELPGISSSQIVDVLHQWGWSKRSAQRAIKKTIEEGSVRVVEQTHADDSKHSSKVLELVE